MLGAFSYVFRAFSRVFHVFLRFRSFALERAPERYSAPGSGLFGCLFGLLSRSCSGPFPAFFLRFFGFSAMAGVFFLHFSRFSQIFDLILLFPVFLLLQLASNAKLHLVLAFFAAEASRSECFQLKSALFGRILARSSPETSRRARFQLKSALFGRILARSAPETSRRGRFQLKSALFGRRPREEHVYSR